MIIDFHTHIFPDRIAKRTIDTLEQAGQIKAFTDGTLASLKNSMLVNNIDISVVLPVVTDSPWNDQRETVNHLKQLDITSEELEHILFKNAEKLLGLKG